MPKRPYVKRKRGKKKYKKKTRNWSMTGQSPQFPMGKRFKTATRYFEKGISIDPPIGGTNGLYTFSANGLYDPNITGTGHQPLGFDQMMLLFDHYVVIGARIRADFVNTDATNSQICGLMLNDDNAPSNTAVVAIENGSCIYRTLTASGGSGNRASLTLTVNPAKYLGRSRGLSDPELKGSISSNPAEQVYFVLFCGDNGVDDSSPIQCNITIEYQVVYIEPKQLGPS